MDKLKSIEVSKKYGDEKLTKNNLEYRWNYRKCMMWVGYREEVTSTRNLFELVNMS